MLLNYYIFVSELCINFTPNATVFKLEKSVIYSR